MSSLWPIIHIYIYIYISSYSGLVHWKYFACQKLSKMIYFMVDFQVFAKVYTYFAHVLPAPAHVISIITYTCSCVCTVSECNRKQPGGGPGPAQWRGPTPAHAWLVRQGLHEEVQGVPWCLHTDGSTAGVLQGRSAQNCRGQFHECNSLYPQLFRLGFRLE